MTRPSKKSTPSTFPGGTSLARHKGNQDWVNRPFSPSAGTGRPSTRRRIGEEENGSRPRDVALLIITSSSRRDCPLRCQEAQEPGGHRSIFRRGGSFHLALTQ